MRARFAPALELLPNIGLIATLGYGGHQVLDGHLLIGELVAFNVYVVMLIWPLRMLGMIIAQGQRSAASAERVFEVLSTDPAIAEPADAVAAARRAGPTGGGEVRFEGVRFAYAPSLPAVLDGLDLVVPAGQSVALVGATGSGKTTVARLLPRFYDVVDGAVSLDGVDVRRLRLRELRKAVGIVFEETFLFSDTIGANIAFADPERAAGGDRARRPPRRCRTSSSPRLPDGYATTIGERGYSLSGGQRQRIAIARAILADPRVLILDDATSSVDPTKEHEIRDALAEVMRGRTTLVIAHRPATIALADRVVLLADGRVAADGTHEELLAHQRRVPGGPGRRRAARGRGPRRRGGELSMWLAGGVDAEDRLDATAARHLLRRTLRMLRPYRRDLVLAGMMVLLWTATTLAGPVPREAAGSTTGSSATTAARSTSRSIGYVVVAVLAYVAGRAQLVLISRIGESFLRDLRVRVFDHLQRLSMPFYDREKAGVIVSRMTSDVDSLQELVQMGLLMFVSNGVLLGVSVVVLGDRVVEAPPAVPGVRPARDRSPASSSSATPTTPTSSCATTSARRSRSCRRASPGCGWSRRTAGRRWRPRASPTRTARSIDAHMRSVKISAWYLPIIETAGLLTTAIAVGVGGWWVHDGTLVIGTVAFFVLTLSNLFEPIQQLSQLFNIVQSAGRRPRQALRPAGHAGGRARAPGRGRPARAGRRRRRGRRLRLRGRGAGARRRRPRTSRPAPASRSSARPAPASRPWPSWWPGSTTPPRGRSASAGSTSATPPPARSASGWSSCRRRGSCSTARSSRTCAWPGRGPPTTRCGRPWPPSACSSGSIGSPRACTPRCRSGGHGSRRGRSSSCRWPGRPSPTPPSSCSTRPPRAWTPAPRSWSSTRSNQLMEGRTVIVIAHRLSTAERADLVGVVADGHLQELGTHAELLAKGGRYTALFQNWSGGPEGVIPGAELLPSA